MAHHKKHVNPVPPANQPKGPPSGDLEQPQTPDRQPKEGAPFQEQDAQRRLGNYNTAGEHARQQPGPLNDG